MPFPIQNSGVLTDIHNPVVDNLLAWWDLSCDETVDTSARQEEDVSHTLDTVVLFGGNIVILDSPGFDYDVGDKIIIKGVPLGDWNGEHLITIDAGDNLAYAIDTVSDPQTNTNVGTIQQVFENSTVVRDLSGNGNTLLSHDPDFPPVYPGSGINGRNTAEINSGVSFGFIFDLIQTASQPFTLYIVYNRDAGGSTGRRLFARRGLFGGSNFAFFGIHFLDWGIARSNGFISTGTKIATQLMDGTSSRWRENGVDLITDVSFGTRTIGSLTIGTSSGKTQPLDGDIGEIIIYEGAHDASQRQAMENYLATKWGVTLP